MGQHVLPRLYGCRRLWDGPATENASSPNLVTVGGTVYDDVSVEERRHITLHEKLFVKSAGLSTK